jgi:hypothetical protein
LKQTIEEGTMPGFFDKLKSGADKAAFEADRLLRLNQAQSAVKSVQRELEAEILELGRQALALHDAGTLTQPELLATCSEIDAKRQEVAAKEAEVERIRQEKPPEAGAPAPEEPPEPAEPVHSGPSYTPPAQQQTPPQPVAPVAGGRTCPNCGTALPDDVRFCPECGTKLG